MPTLQKLSLIVFASLTTLCLNATAQVYQSTDEQGNVTFSDTPTAGSEAVNIGAPNIADPVEVPPPAPTPAPVVEAKPAAPAQQPVPELDNDSDDGGSGWNGRRLRHRNAHVHRDRRGGR